jgi:hypothetical protein
MDRALPSRLFTEHCPAKKQSKIDLILFVAAESNIQAPALASGSFFAGETDLYTLD